jgi:Flp pilus assembly protein TadD
VESNPDDHEQRWRLAKKLYTAWEYRLALEHLQILKNEGPERINILRYLGATYYRLGRYDEAIKELRSAIATWPDEIGIYEQLARVLEIAGDHVGAADMWDMALQLDPHHPMAAHAAERLRSNLPGAQKKKTV